MKFLDRVALNRSMSIIFSFIISLIKIFMPKLGEDLDKNNPVPPLPKPPLKRRGRLKKDKTDE